MDFHKGRQFFTSRSNSHVRMSTSSWQPGKYWPQPSHTRDIYGNKPREWATPHHQAEPARAGQGQNLHPRGQRAKADSYGRLMEGEGMGAVVGGEGVAGGLLGTKTGPETRTVNLLIALGQFCLTFWITLGKLTLIFRILHLGFTIQTTNSCITYQCPQFEAPVN